MSATAKQDTETLSQRWPWVETRVWTERMLAALENGVKGGKWKNAYFAERGLFSLHDAHVLACQSRCGNH